VLLFKISSNSVLITNFVFNKDEHIETKPQPEENSIIILFFIKSLCEIKYSINNIDYKIL
jgi:hypothetical protein